MSSLLESLEEILFMEDKIQIITDLAFEAVDEDGSGSIDQKELGAVLKLL